MINKSKYTLLIAGCLVMILGGCELPSTKVAKYWQTVDGSKTDGTVTLAYNIGAREVAIISEAQGLSEARRACKNWGYNSAASFTAAQSTCTSKYDYVNYNTVHKFCKAWEVTKKYQCRDAKEEKASKPDKILSTTAPISAELSFGDE